MRALRVRCSFCDGYRCAAHALRELRAGAGELPDRAGVRAVFAPYPDRVMSKLAAAVRRETAKERLASLERGGSPDRPIRVASASVIESRTAALACPHCGGAYRVHEHTRPVPSLRKVDVACRHCSTPRTLWFTIVPSEPN